MVPLIERLAGELGALVSVDTYKPAVARAAIAAGARDRQRRQRPARPRAGRVCAETGAALVVMHTRAAPKQRLQDPDLYGDIVDEVLALPARAHRAGARRRGDARAADRRSGSRLRQDTRPDDRLLAGVARLHELGRPLLMAISRKDFIGALTGRAPRERLAGTLAALAHGVDAGAHIFRVHDVRRRRGFPGGARRARGRERARAGSWRSPRNCATRAFAGAEPALTRLRSAAGSRLSRLTAD